MAGIVTRSLKKGVSSLVITAFLLSGCVTTQSQRIGADDGSDECRAYLVALDATGDYFAEDMLKGAAIGAVAGGLIGALASGGKDAGRNALIGAAAGAALGAAGGYWNAKSQQEKDKAVLYQSVLSDIEKENAKIDEAQFALDKLVDCRRSAFTKVRQAYRDKQITRQEAEARWNRLLALQENDLKVAQTMNKNISDRSSQFAVANTELNKVDAELTAEEKARRDKLIRDVEMQQAAEKQRLEQEQAERRKALARQQAKDKAAKAALAAQQKQLDADAAKELAALKDKQAQQAAALKSPRPEIALQTSTNQSKLQKVQNTVVAMQNAKEQPGGFENNDARLHYNGPDVATADQAAVLRG